jgi:hypothetical protein
MVQAIGCQPVTADNSVRSRANPCEARSRQSGTLRLLQFSPVPFH